MSMDRPATPRPLSESERLHELETALDTIYEVGRVLSRSFELRETLTAVLKAMDHGGLRGGMVTLLDPETQELVVDVAHGLETRRPVRYQPGEGIFGAVMESGSGSLIPCIEDEPRFLNRTGLFDPSGAFIAEPIKVGGEAVGVLACQPDVTREAALAERVRLVRMVAQLVGQSVQLAWQVRSEREDLEEERDGLRRAVRNQYGFSNIVGHSIRMQRVFEQVRQVGKWNTTVLIRGETGTGKELIAHAIHYNSPRSANAFVKLNCAALPENLLESELFGHEKGAFTGAVATRKGRFEQADSGTLFLDEIGEVSPGFQAKLLRVLQEGELERVGGNRTIKVDVRLVAATHRDLELAVEEGSFREDLYYRLNVMPINLPALRERVEDIPEIARFLVDKIGRQQGRPLAITDAALRVLTHYDWPGNVRELENCLERAAVMSMSGEIDRDDVLDLGLEEKVTESRATTELRSTIRFDDPNLDEREKVIAALEQSGWVQAKAARLLGMTPRQIAYRIQTLNIKVRQF
jgi:Nif-specific regulatory protein